MTTIGRCALAAAMLAASIAASIAAAPLPAAAGGAEATAYDDPFAYCAAVGTIDAPDERYAGAAMPEVLARKLRTASGAPADAPLAPFREAAFWRCLDGEVYACTVGANLPCTTKADLSRAPSAAMEAFCRETPEAPVPAVVTGRTTVYNWRCAGGRPVIEGAPRAVDAAGFFADIWYRLN